MVLIALFLKIQIFWAVKNLCICQLVALQTFNKYVKE